MLDIGDTGYEGKFDFATPGELSTFYMLAAIPRTGSYYLAHLLWQTGCLGAPLEYINFDGPYAFAANSPELQQWLWRSVVRRRTSPNGVFGLKCFPTPLKALQDGNPALLAEVTEALRDARHPRRLIHLTRRDRAAHMASLARAAMTGIWRQEQEKDATLQAQYSDEAMEAAGRGIDAQAAIWERMFDLLKVEPLRIFYEDVVAQPDEAVRTVANYLGVEIAPDAAIQVPAIRKQSGSDTAEWAERYVKAYS